MTEQNVSQSVSNETTLGKIEIAPEVIEIIASIASTEIEGVTAMRGSFAGDVAEKLGKKNLGKGVRVELTEESIILEVYVYLHYGVNIPEVANNVQQNVRNALYTMTGLEATEVNVHVVGVQFDAPKSETVEK
ncbi:MAG: Asp23/Gls24 family envelope stress response protein [Bacilli bacterium]